MSWGYFLDATLTLPDTAWKTISKKKADEFPTKVGWWGLKDPELERRFVDMFGDCTKGWPLAKVVKSFARDESIGAVSSAKGATTIRILELLNKDMDTDVARGVSALFEAAAPLGGAGSVSLVNDGTYSGEDGATVTLVKGKLSRKRLTDCWALAEKLGAQMFGDDEAFLDEEEFLEASEDEARPTPKAAKKKAPKKKAPKKKAKK
ncbi:MAG: hypothetical protein JNM69_14570 [Archangium sp.]|nr:hypothetical protein [Archangium sp.]